MRSLSSKTWRQPSSFRDFPPVGKLQRGDVVVAKSPTNPRHTVCKRCAPPPPLLAPLPQRPVDNQSTVTMPPCPEKSEAPSAPSEQPLRCLARLLAMEGDRVIVDKRDRWGVLTSHIVEARAPIPFCLSPHLSPQQTTYPSLAFAQTSSLSGLSDSLARVGLCSLCAGADGPRVAAGRQRAEQHGQPRLRSGPDGAGPRTGVLQGAGALSSRRPLCSQRAASAHAPEGIIGLQMRA